MLLQHYKCDERGLSIMESLISVIVLSIMLAGGLNFYFNASAVMAQAMHKKMAMEMAVQEVEEIKNKGYDDLTDPGIGSWESLPADTFEDFTAQIRRRVIDDTISAFGAFKKVEVEVSWTEVDQVDPKVIKLVTYMAP